MRWFFYSSSLLKKPGLLLKPGVFLSQRDSPLANKWKERSEIKEAKEDGD